MKNIIPTLAILISIMSNSYGQDNIIKCDNEIDSETYKYIGCLDVENRPQGYGIVIYNDGAKYEGNWSKGKQNGFGKYTYSEGGYYEGNWVNNKQDGFGKYVDADGDIYEGYFKNNMKNGEGKYSYKIGNQSVFEKGFFKNGNFFSGEKKSNLGNGTIINSEFKNGDRIKLVQISPEFRIESSGSFFSNGILKTGIQKNIYQNGNLIIEKEFENGDEVIGSEKSNIKNYYIPNDIDGDLQSIIIDLETEPNDNSKYVNMKFMSEKSTDEFYRFIFDTGAEAFSLGYRLFNKLKENGLEYEDMNVIVKSVGISGLPVDNKVIRLKELTIGEYKVKNVIALVKTVETSNTSLLGIGFMKKFKNVYWSLNDDQLILFK